MKDGSVHTSTAISILRRMLAVLWFVSIAAIVCLALVTNLGPRFGLHMFAIRGGSMTPAIPLGAAVLATPTDPEDLRVGDIVTIRADNGVIYTHRVVEIDPVETDVWLRTKGDANTTADPAFAPVSSVVGRVGVSVPVVGYLIVMLGTPPGLMSFLAYAVALLLAISELEAAQDAAHTHRGPARSPDVARA